jgi:uncharacterized protein (TIGR02271 family)
MAERYSATHDNLAPLSKLSDYEVADDSVDVRGWKVSGNAGAHIGTVEDLIVDSATMQAQYLVVRLEDEVQRTTAGSSAAPVLVPVSRARLDDSNNRVHLDSSGAGLAQLPRYQGDTIERDYSETFGRHEERGVHHEGAQKLTRSAEELRVGKRRVDAGEVHVRKHVETERVSQPVTRTREDVHVERRPVSDREGARGAEIREDEVRVPITEEEVVVDKRPVVKEELVITKDRVEETENVEADLRKEKIDVDRPTTRGTAYDKDRGTAADPTTAYDRDPKKRGKV